MTESKKPSAVYWIVAVLALLWFAKGAHNYLLMAFKDEGLWSTMTVEQVALIESLPAWMTALFALGVWGGVLACIGLFLRNKHASTVFLISFVAGTIHQLYWLFGTDSRTVFAEHSPYVMPILVIVIGALMVWYSRKLRASGMLT